MHALLHTYTHTYTHTHTHTHTFMHLAINCFPLRIGRQMWNSPRLPVYCLFPSAERPHLYVKVFGWTLMIIAILLLLIMLELTNVSVLVDSQSVYLSDPNWIKWNISLWNSKGSTFLPTVLQSFTPSSFSQLGLLHFSLFHLIPPSLLPSSSHNCKKLTSNNSNSG